MPEYRLIIVEPSDLGSTATSPRPAYTVRAADDAPPGTQERLAEAMARLFARVELTPFMGPDDPEWPKVFRRGTMVPTIHLVPGVGAILGELEAIILHEMGEA